MIKNSRNKDKPLATMWREHWQPLAAMRVIGKEHKACVRAGMIKNNRNKDKPLARMWREHCQPLAAMRGIGKEHNL